MRSLLIFLTLAILLSSCNNTPIDKSGQPCEAYCANPGIWVNFELPQDSVTNAKVTSYYKNTNFALSHEEGYPENIYLDTTYDYEIYLPAINKTYRLWGVKTIPTRYPTTTTHLGYCTYTCFNPLDSNMHVTLDGQPRSWTFKRTGQGEHKLTLEY